ncbi:MAG: hypothetical protein HUK40_17785 [Desulfobacter sp.]|nr:hypothetical protein [Desulfobacter sp.]WDP85805.1 MAG: hypothetical protein HUN05_12240 [Desulfobacter sp.]
MEPNKFRESRQAINRMCENVDQLIEDKAVEESKTGFEEVSGVLDTLRPQAEGEIQERSVKNLGMKISILASKIAKLKTKKTSTRRSAGTAKPMVVWDEERVGQLSAPFLRKVFANMGGDAQSKVFFGTTGKGIRPNYRIEYSDKRLLGFTGSGHKPQDPPSASGAKNLSDPFDFQVIESALKNK